MRLDESNKKNEFLRNQISSQDEKMKSLEQKLTKSKAELKKLSNTKLAANNRSVSDSVSVKPKEKIYIPPFKRNHKEKAYVTRLDKGKNSDVDAEVSKPKSKPTIREHNKYVFVPTCHLCGVVCHIRPNCSLLRQISKSESRFVVRNTNVPKFVHACHFCGVHGHIHSNCHKEKFNHSVFHSRMWDDFSPTIRSNKLFHMLLKSLSLLACENKLQDFNLSQKKFTIPQIHFASHGFHLQSRRLVLYG